MRFSSDEQLFEQNSINQQQPNANPKTPLKKKQKKETMLSKFLDSLNSNVMTKLHNYEKLKRPVFERRAIVPQKLSLYEDVLFILLFKENQQKIMSDSKEVKTICLDLESRTKRKECTIRERLQKKLCKMTPQELLDHVANDKDISFNLKKVLTSGGKGESERTINKSEADVPSLKNKIDQNKTPMKQEKMNDESQRSEEKDYDKVSMKLQNSPSKLDEQIFFEKQNNQDQIKQEGNSSSITQEIDEKEIFIVFKKNDTSKDILMFNKVLIQKEINEMKRKQKQAQAKQQLTKQLKIQMEVILHFKNKTTSIPQQVKALILEAQKIMRILGISSYTEVQNQQKQIQQKNQEKKASITLQEETADKKINDNEKIDDKTLEIENQDVSQFNINEEAKNNQENKLQENQSNYTISYALCNNDEYIKLYNSNTQIFEPLLWTEEEDNLVDKLIEDFSSNEKLFSLLVRYKGVEWFIQRCIFLGKNMESKDLNDAIKANKPLNMSRFNGYMASLEEKKEREEQNVIKMGNGQEMQIIC